MNDERKLLVWKNNGDGEWQCGNHIIAVFWTPLGEQMWLWYELEASGGSVPNAQEHGYYDSLEDATKAAQTQHDRSNMIFPA